MKFFKKCNFYIVIIIMVILSCTKSIKLKTNNETYSVDDLEIWLDVNNQTINFKNDKQIKTAFRKMGESIAFSYEAVETEFSKKPYVSNILKISEDNYFVAEYLENMYFKNDNCKLDTFEIHHIFISDKNSDYIKKVEDLKLKIETGYEFENLAKAYSEDITSNTGGRLGYVVKGMLPKNYYREIEKYDFENKKIKIAYTEKGAYLFKLTERKKLSISEIKKLAESTKHKERMIRDAEKAIVLILLDDIKREVNFKYDEQLIKKIIIDDNVNSVLFSVSQNEYKKVDFDNLLQYYKFIYRKKGNFPDKLSMKRKLSLINEIIPIYLLKYRGMKEGYDENKNYKLKEKILRMSILSREYADYLRNSTIINVTDSDVKKEYDKNKKFHYSYTVKKNGKFYQEPIPFDKIKNDIRKKLISEKKELMFQKLINSLMKKYQIKVFSN